MQNQSPQATSLTPQAVRPRAVNIAVFIYLVNLVVSLLYDSIDDQNLELPKSFELLMLRALYLSAAIELVLLRLVARGVNWARYLLAALVVFVTVGYLAISDNLLELHEYTAYTYFALLSAVANVVCIALLFSKSVAPWFRRRSLIQHAA